MSDSKDAIGRAHKIATELFAESWSAVDGCTVLAMALGIFAEGFEGGDSANLDKLMNPLLTSAKMSFDALRAGRDAPANN